MSDTIDILKKLALQVRNAVDPAENTAERVGRVLVGLLENLSSVDLEELAKIFLRKDQPGTTAELITFAKGLISKEDSEFEKSLTVGETLTANEIKSATHIPGQFGSGYRIKVNPKTGDSEAEVDRLLVRKEAIFNKLSIAEIKSVGGAMLLSCASMTCLKVEELEDVYRCFFDTDEGTITNQFALNDQAICRRWNGQGMKYYWRLVTSVGTDYIDLSKMDVDGLGVPTAQDEIIQFGNRTDASRQSALYKTAYGINAPAEYQYDGINSYDLSGKEAVVISPSGNKFTGEFHVKTGNTSVRIPADKGEWVAGAYSYYDRVSHNGSLWLALVNTSEEPGDSSADWLKQVSEGGTGYRIEKLATPGYEFYRENQVYNHTLSVRVYLNEEDITETLNMQRFKWTRVSENTDGDPTWNELHANSGHQIDITGSDLAGDTFFILQFYDVTNNRILTTKF